MAFGQRGRRLGKNPRICVLFFDEALWYVEDAPVMSLARYSIED